MIRFAFKGDFGFELGGNTNQTEIADDYFDTGENGPEGPGSLNVQDEFLPVGGQGELVKHRHYALSYDEQHEQAEWVAYELTRESIQAPNVERTGDFRRDNHVKSRSADREDYRGSGFDRGHMVPAGDMAFSREAMSETFLMSNMSPQKRAFNGGVWRELEENTRDWAYKFRHIYVVSGPIYYGNVQQTIGNNKVSVPDAYFKVILDRREPEKKAIAFIIPNEVSEKHLRAYAKTIDEVEKITGLDFFANLLSEDEEMLEEKIDVSLWKFNEGKFKNRIKNWNFR